MKPSKLLFSLIAMPAMASAVQISHDPFDIGVDPAVGQYVDGTTNLIGQSPVVIGASGAWLAAYGGAQSADVLAGGLTFPGLPTSGGSVRYTGGGNGRCGRLLAAPYGDATSGVVYLSVLIQLESASDSYAAFELHNGGFDDGGNRTLQIAAGESSGGLVPAGELGLRVNNDDGLGATLGALDTAVNLFVLRFDFSTDASGDSLTVYRNPTDLAVEANNTVAATLSGFDFRFDRMSFARFNGSTGIAFDELRIGTEFDDVTGSVDLDEDDDGMDDGWEFTNGVDDPDGDALLDNDGLTNLEEFLAGTNPNLADTDGDDVDDKAELDGTGNAFDGMETDPTVADSDGDGLDDGEESGTANGFVTNPNAADTDGDGEDDATEIANNTSPLDGGDNSAANGVFIIDGKRDSLYGGTLAVQTVDTGFGDNLSELNAGYGAVSDGKLYLLITGNIEANFNKLEIFIDSKTGGSTMLATAGNDGAGAMDGLVFDAAFAPDYHLIARRNGTQFDLDFADLGTVEFAFFQDVFGGSAEGSAVTGAADNSTFGTAPAPIAIGYDNSNVAGVGGDTGAPADPVAAAAVSTGLELCIDLAALGHAGGDIKVCAFVNNSAHDFASNQFLGGLPGGSGNLGGLAAVDLGAFAGDQFFAVPAPESEIEIAEITFDPDTREVGITFTSVEGQRYIIDSSADGEEWGDVEDDFLAGAGATSTFEFVEDAPLPVVKLYRVRPTN